jgi:hypothetical protein
MNSTEGSREMKSKFNTKYVKGEKMEKDWTKKCTCENFQQNGDCEHIGNKVLEEVGIQVEDSMGSYHIANTHIEEVGLGVGDKDCPDCKVDVGCDRHYIKDGDRHDRMSQSIKEQLQSGWYVQLKQLPINCEGGFFYWGVSEYDDGWHKQWQEVVREKPEAFALCFTLQSAKSLVDRLSPHPSQ